ncbi:hypothetical protein QQS21_001491 [Conoideocrella luteorostrata]|uniref:Thioesterase family protein n=1 Tax=Conoideocrella luteorostrata TaxID=1105319 RepID=A0AAJ0FYA2_9HYPO|nr:hypothetical protein QQS21_001491 [Conoideocrella luteorostrata]
MKTDSILKRQIDLKKTSSNTYSASWHSDWTLGNTLNGGCIAAVIHHAFATHIMTDDSIVARNQPHVLSLKLEFLRSCEKSDSSITIEPLKIGKSLSTFEVRLVQGGKLRVLAQAKSINFDKVHGPTAATDWRLYPDPPPKPNFGRVLAQQPDENWVPGLVQGELIPLTGRKLGLFPRVGFPINGVCDAWNGFLGDERMDATYLALMTDMIPSMSDTLLRNGGPYDAHVFHAEMERWAKLNPGIPCVMTNSIADAMKATSFVYTNALSIEYKRKIPEGGLRWVFTRAATKMLRNGVMDIEVSLCDEEEEVLAIAHHQDLILGVDGKFRDNKIKSAL